MTQSRINSVLIAAAGAVIVVAGLKAASGIVGPLMLALALTVLFHPMRIALERRVPSWAASVAVIVAAYAMILLFALALVVSIGRLAALIPTYASDIDGHVSSVGAWLEARGVGAEQVAALEDSADVGRLLGVASDVFSGILGVLSDGFFLLALLLFLAFDAAQAAKLAAGVRLQRPHLVSAMESFAQGTRTYLGVSTVFGLIVATIDGVLLWALGVPGAVVWGVLAFVTNFIPNIGFVIGLVPPALVAFLEGGPGLMLTVIVTYSLINVVIQSVIQPRYVGHAVGLSTTLTFLSLVFWAWVLGPLGALLAVPMSLFVKALLVEADPGARWLDPLISGRPDMSPG